MKQPLFTGVCTALVTPFRNGEVNYTMLETLLRRQIDAGIRAVVICGTTGESPTLSDEEKIKLFSRAKAYVGDACRIIAGTGSNSTEHAIRLSVAAQKTGVDGLLVVTPYYNKATPEGLFTHYRAIAEQVSLPIIVYNVPGRTGVDIPVGVYSKLAEIPNIAGVKEASTDITKVARIRCTCSQGFSLWSGNDDQTVPTMSIGGKGIISVLSNILPKDTLAMTNAALQGDFETAAELQCRLLPLIDALFCEVNPIPVKEALKLQGFDCGGYRLPLVPMAEKNAKQLQQALRDCTSVSH